MLKIIAALLLSALTTQSLANIYFSNFNRESGLPDSRIWSITQDKKGLIWIGTGNGLAQYDGYSFTNFNLNSSQTLSLNTNHIKELYVDENDGLWLGTLGGGLVKYDKGTFSVFPLPGQQEPKDILSIQGENNYIWVGTEQGLYIIHLLTNDISHINPNHLPISHGESNERINSITHTSSSTLVATDSNILEFDQNKQFNKILPIQFPDQELRIRKVINETDQSILVATNENLYRYSLQKNQLVVVSQSLADNIILDALVVNDTILVSTFKNGLLLVSPEGAKQYKHSKTHSDSLPNNIIIDLFRSKDGVIWAGTFDGLSKINPALDSFGLLSHKNQHLTCLTNDQIIALDVLSSKRLLMSSTEQVIIYNPEDKSCQEILPATDTKESLYNFTVYDSLEEENNLWLASSYGLLLMNKQAKIQSSISLSPNKPRVYSIDKYGEHKLIAGTTEGVFLINKTNMEVSKLTSSDPVSGQVVNFVKSKQNIAYIGTEEHLYKYDGQTIKEVNIKSNLPLSRANDIILSDDFYFIATNRGAIYQLAYDDTLVDEFLLDEPEHVISVQSIQMDSDKAIWASTLDGLYHISLTDHKITRFGKADGLQSNAFNIRAHAKDDNNLYFAGNKGITKFNPNQISIKPEEPKVVATAINIYSDDDVVRSSTVNHKQNHHLTTQSALNLSYQENDFSIEFAGIYYTDPQDLRYAYILQGAHKDWIYTNSNNRTTTFSNLAPGEYIFKVKAATKHGVWSSNSNLLTIPITISPPVWLTWWAKTIYVITAVLFIALFIRLRTKTAIQRAETLQQEVARRTHQIASQKSIIENLLEKKNELFANISHEFRTPLTLILGPLQKELESTDSPKNPKNLQMIQRNASRLLAMVEQILKLAELTKNNPKSKSVIELNHELEHIAEMFAPLAEKKGLSLTLRLSKTCNLLIVDDSLEVMIGNLLSNAIKYSDSGGQVELTTRLTEQQVYISVIDTGSGIEQHQQETIFERFVRLEKTSDISGTGIGLSIVKQLVTAHKGDISVDSHPGKGSTFTIKLPQTNLPVVHNNHSAKSSIAHLINDSSLQPQNDSQSELISEADDRESLLIIDDNPDMREYLVSIFSNNYHCYATPRGEQGVELAIDVIPDLVLCDVMMPGIDGYQVAHQLRADNRTSHIPIVLLTAKGDKHSRIKGWDNDIDAYMTKPFDEDELKLRIKNILTIRAILKEKASSSLVTSTTGNRSTLNQREQDFIDRLYKVFELNYQDPDITRAHIANQMAISERQLQRKIKGLIDKNPMDLFRDYRLIKAEELLMTGKPINLVSDFCGFSSPSYFSQCFKAKFGLSPKTYQNKTG